MPIDRRTLARHAALALTGGSLLSTLPRPSYAASRAEIDAQTNAALTTLRGMPNTAPLFERAQAVLIFPRIVSGGLIVGGQYGEGILFRGNERQGYYRIAGASFGLQAGAQVAGLAMFFMTDEALRALQAADGWEIGTGPSVVALDRGVQANVTATTLREPVYAVTFGQEGLMAALTINGTKISPFNPV
ncbi:lipid-binding SYLF domain-containing protein [Falsiroseomonas tokyonensis]|uniref:YSC84-related protein n=1 Tax=Falsiroseomonas tokyonensis TaxID=430521 RepID=A0ABV7BWT4_9PROT|nr:lipid-binding SYLF domain-containing protein [Falsiroseomonas tokyonensis]MBU8539087.1 lipid-binding SYLF domain-containing protein [Falsiroseomonas tokyonensis]